MACGFCSAGKCTTLPDCCGNNFCEDAENECTCPSDCGTCKSDVDYLSKGCNEDRECVADINQELLNKKESQSNDVKIRNSIVNFIPSFNSPFILGYSRLNINIKPDKMEDKATIFIKRIKVYDMVTRSTKVLLAEEDINQYLYTTNSKVDENIILEVERNNTNTNDVIEDEMSLSIEVFYEYVVIDYSGKETKYDSSFTIPLNKVVKVIIPPTSECNVNSCDDDNDCTDDRCMLVNDYNYCVNDYKTSKCCGNKQCDSGEDRCNCAIDCGECNYDDGQFLHYSCSSRNKCVPSIKEDLSEDKSLTFDSVSVPEIQFNAKLSYEEPFNVDSSLDIEMSIIYVNDQVTNAKITSIELLSGNEIIGELDIDAAVPTAGSTKIYKISPSITIPEVERSLYTILSFTFEYNTPIGDTVRFNRKKETMKLGTVTFVNLD